MTITIIRDSVKRYVSPTLEYRIDKNLFCSIDEFNECREAVKSGHIKLEEVKAIFDIEIMIFYNDLANHFFGIDPIDSELIFYRQAVHDWIENNYPNKFIYFCILKNNGHIGTCGLGYLFESHRLTPTDEVYQMAENCLKRGISYG